MVCCAVALVAAGCGSGTPAGSAATGGPATGTGGASDSSGATGTASGTATGGATGTASGGATAGATSCAARAYQRLTKAERIGQLFLVGIPVPGSGAPSVSTFKADHFGSALFVGNTGGGVDQVRALTNEMQRLAPAGVGMFVAANQEGGEIQPLRGPGFDAMPPATVQGTMRPSTLKASATRWGHQLMRAGVNLNLAPVLDTVPAGTESANAPIGALRREFGDSARVVSSHGVAFIDGMRAAGVATTAKHFPGLGRVRGNTDFTADVVDTTTTRNDLAPYQAAIDARVPFVMMALARYTRLDASRVAAFSPAIVTGLLRNQMGFRGVIVSDDLGAAAVAGIPAAERAEEFLAAGGDMLTEQAASVAAQMVPVLLRETATDQRFRDRVDDAVMKILAAKAEYGLLAC